ncbi:hypothetical protein FJV41_02480 [Myxococcus llanfairpwllgwyngyllgogerychwyrndrobwllllantysiliogogogochensis]|uniref:Uncharacterized protein n=1 Tax=Myxococcus llanfairpwllgwyngyllgogerychwyrndrobwllllantysiliogogogochensis TaxID=2590453 RepID=A0A540X9Z7_9BACT|nr:hypothetical protein FJV41_02480 [Myxococcus llanfairpwllgwyngyllgogerychwyrndrobwllllantysiliogogogochensis]
MRSFVRKYARGDEILVWSRSDSGAAASGLLIHPGHGPAAPAGVRGAHRGAAGPRCLSVILAEPAARFAAEDRPCHPAGEASQGHQGRHPRGPEQPVGGPARAGQEHERWGAAHRRQRLSHEP